MATDVTWFNGMPSKPGRYLRHHLGETHAVTVIRARDFWPWHKGDDLTVGTYYLGRIAACEWPVAPSKWAEIPTPSSTGGGV